MPLKLISSRLILKSRYPCLLLSLNHPNVVRYVDSFEWNEELWMVMEFLEGGSLKQAYETRKLSENDISFIARQLLKGLYYLHGRNIIHRDLKSANIMLSVGGDVKLIDFGLAEDISRGSKKQMSGSAFWMAPEVVLGKNATPAVDIWSLGIVLLEIANREIPNRHSQVNALVSIASGRTPQLNDNHWSNDFKEFITKCLTFDPVKRPNADDLYKLDFITKGPVREAFIPTVEAIFLSQALPMDI